MAILVNRKYSSRMECVYYIFKSAYSKYGTHTSFKMQQLKFNEEDEFNTHQYCQLLVEGWVKYCPYLENQFDTSKCYATQSVESDSTKDKAVSDIIRSLEGMGFVQNVGASDFIITCKGEKWVNSEFGTREWQTLLDEAVLSYGPFVGFIYKIKAKNSSVVNLNEIYIGYPNTQETIKVTNGETYAMDESADYISVELSEGSQKDSVTRTRSKFVSLGVSTGLILPSNSVEVKESAYIQNRDFLNKKRLTIRNVKITNKMKDTLTRKLFVEHPLSFNHLVKEGKSLRENGIQTVREATLNSEAIIKKRRFIIVDILNRASKDSKAINLLELYNAMSALKDKLFVDKDERKHLMILQSELDIAALAGIPFEIITYEGKVMLEPLTQINENELRFGAPEEAIQLADIIWEKIR